MQRRSRSSSCSSARRCAAPASSSSTRSTAWATAPSCFGVALGGAFAFLAAALIVVGKRLVVTEELEEPYPAAEHPAEQRRGRADRARERRAASRASGCSPAPPRRASAAARAGGAHARAVARSGPGHRRAATRRRGGADAARRRERPAVFSAATSRRARSTRPSRRAPTRTRSARRWSSCGSIRAACSCPESRGLGARGHPGLLEDLHARRLRDRALSQADVPCGRAAPALVCPCHYSTFDPATGGTVIFGPAGRAAAAAAADDRRRRHAAGGRRLLRPRRPVLVGRADAADQAR